MESISDHEAINNIDQISEGYDWYTFAEGCDTAKKIKSTATKTLISMKDKDDEEGRLALKELSYRLASDNLNEDGDPRFKTEFPGFELVAGDVSLQLIDESIEEIELTLEEKRDLRIAQIATRSEHTNLLKQFILSENFQGGSILNIRESWQDFMATIFEAALKIGSKGKIKCIKPWGACNVGQVYPGVWNAAGFSGELRFDVDPKHFPRATRAPSIFFNPKLKNSIKVPKQFELL
jgi:hypothetical protein